MSNPTIGVTQIEKRRKSIIPVSESEHIADTLYLRDIALISEGKHLSSEKEDICKFIRESADGINANAHYDACIGIIENAKEYQNTAVYEMLNVIPYIKYLDIFIEAVSRSSIEEFNKNVLIEEAEDYMYCDRILKNHAQLCKRFNVDRFMKESTQLPTDILVIELCSMIDTFEKSNPVTKLNTCIEECSYLLNKAGRTNQERAIVNTIVNYFLCRENSIDPAVYEGYKKMLTENRMLLEDDLSSVDFFLDPAEEKFATKLEYLFARFRNRLDKSEEDFFAFISDICDIANNGSGAILSNITNILQWLTNYVLSNLYNTDTINKALDMILAVFLDDTSKNSVGACSKFIEILSSEITRIGRLQSYTENVALMNLISKYEEMISKLRDSINLRSENSNAKSANGDLYSLKEYVVSPAFSKVHRMNEAIKNQLINMELQCVNTIYEHSKPIMLSERNITKDENVLEFVTDDCSFDHTVAIFDVDENAIDEVKNAANTFCIKMNNSYSDNGIRCYYECIDYIIEFHIEDSTVLDLTSFQEEERDNIFTEAELSYFGMLDSLSEIADRFSYVDTELLMENYAAIEPYITADQLCNVIELSEVMNGLISYDRINEIAKSYREYHPDDYAGNTKIAEAIRNWSLQGADIEIVSEAVIALNEALLTEKINFKPGKEKEEGKKDGKDDADKSKEMGTSGKSSGSLGKKDSGKDDKVEEKEDKREDKKDKIKDKLNLNTLKFLAIDLKNKAKKLDTKAKKASEEMDMMANRFIKAVKDLYTNDNRESIIKGSIIPSFHKLYQRAVVGAVGSGVIAIFNPALALASAAAYTISLIAVSKHSTNKERALLLDEIDIELDALEKEIANAESRNQMKRYRILLTHKKKLQREKQRIKYKASYRHMVLSDLPDKDI